MQISLEDLLTLLEMAQEDLLVEIITPEADPIKENVLVANHKLIREAANEVISFIARGPIRLKNSVAIQKVSESLLLLRGLMEGIIQQYEIDVITTLKGSLEDWVCKSFQDDEGYTKFD